MTAVPTIESLELDLMEARFLIYNLHQTEMRLRDELKQCDVNLKDALVDLERLRSFAPDLLIVRDLVALSGPARPIVDRLISVIEHQSPPS